MNNGFNIEKTDLDVSKVSCQHPIDPSDNAFHRRLSDDVNKLVAVGNTQCHTPTCYKYKGKAKGCHFGFPWDLVTESAIKDNEILLKRTSPVINNFNPATMTCLGSNHDIKFIPSGKDDKACSFYMTDYATKASLSSHQMFPLIAASLMKITFPDKNLVNRSKIMITKCLNRITTETEM